LVAGAVTLALVVVGVALPTAASAANGCTITGTDRADRLIGTEGDDVLCGLGGEDTLIGLGGNDVLRGGNGSDVLDGGDGDDVLEGENEHDRLSGGVGRDTLRGGNGMDVLDGGADDDVLRGGNDADSLSGGTGADDVAGELGIDLLSGGAGNDVLTGGNDQDTIFGGPGDDRLAGELGNDVLYGNSGNDLLDGNKDQDRCFGAAGANTYVSCETKSDDPSLGGGEGDADGDAFADELELLAGTDALRADTDRDGLADAAEYAAATDPLRADTDRDGIADGADDTDGDGLTNRAETAVHGTDPADQDTDGDEVADGAEITRGTNPLVADTDSDGLTDGEEPALGANPLVADSDGDGVLDGQDTHSRDLVDAATGATFHAVGVGAAVLDVSLAAPQDGRLADAPGQRGPPIEVLTGSPLVSGTLTLRFDPSSVDPNARLSVLHYDDESAVFDVPADQTIDLATGTATVTTDNFSPFVLVDRDEFDAVWASEITVPRTGGGGTTQPIDTAVVLDSSGSMSWNDPGGARRTAGKAFVDALLGGDRIAVVDFDSWATVLQALTTDHDAAKAAIDMIDDDGGTDIGAGLQAALDHLDALAEPGRARVVVLLTDGEGSYSSSLTTRARDSGTVVYTVGLGSSVDENLLASIASGTGGTYFQVENADDLIETFGRIGTDLGAADTDGDGVADEAEVSGVRDGTGHVYRTDPTNPDTDGDDLTDGEELGELVNSAGFGAGTYFTARTDPTKADTDGDRLDDWYEVANVSRARDKDFDRDGLDDFDELQVHFTEPLSNDTDTDGHTDDWELDHAAEGFDPLVYDETYEWYEYAGDFARGALCGDAEGLWGFCDGTSVPYFVGVITVGFVAVGDVRDAIANVFKGDALGVGLSLVGIVPFIGDGASVARHAVKWVERAATSKAGAALRHIAGAGYLPTSVKITILDLASGGAVKSIKARGVVDDSVLAFARRGVSVKHVKAVLDAARRVEPGNGKYFREATAENALRRTLDDPLPGRPGRALEPGGKRNLRYLDVIDQATKIGHEVKFGLVTKLGRAGMQVTKDATMVANRANPDVVSVQWDFYSNGAGLFGPDPDLLAHLVANNIPFVMHLP
jgi:hypothetical protein